jgi:putative sterol carrier protein
MAEFLSSDWLDAMRRAAEGSVVPVVEPTIVVQQVVTGPTDVTWWIELGAGTVSLHPGRTEEATVTFTQDLETAAAINQGTLSAQAAFMTGRLEVRGDVQVLLDRQAEMLGVDDVFAAVRADTTY